MYKTVEIFDSIQGEGSWVGKPVTFIRLFGCNCNCPFCDEPLHKESKNITKLSAENILKLCKQKYVVITGGEPSLNNINPLIMYLQKHRKIVGVESNGYKYTNISSANLVTLSPKDYNTRPDGVWDNVKLLISTTRVNTIKKEINYWNLEGSKVFISAINEKDSLNMLNNKLAYELCLKQGTTLSVQLHKILGVR